VPGRLLILLLPEKGKYQTCIPEEYEYSLFYWEENSPLGK